MREYKINQETCDLIRAKVNLEAGTSYTATVLPDGSVEMLPDDDGITDFVEEFLTQLKAHENSKGLLLNTGPLVMKGVRRYSWILLLLFAGCGIEDKRPDPYPVGATNIQSYGKGWSTFEWQKQEFLQFSSDNGHGYRIISITKLGPMSRARAIVEEMRVTSSGEN